MANGTEPAKLLLPYLLRADELQKQEPLIAYYCRLYAMESGVKIPQSERTKKTTALLRSLMNQLEKDRKAIELGDEDNLYVERFALNMFAKTDKKYHAGKADLNTAKMFYAASILFEILNQFGTLQPDLEQKREYAIWKAADIRKALKEGRKPTPDSPASDEDLSIPPSTPNNRYELGPAETTVTSPRPESDPPHNYHDSANYQHLPSIHPSPEFHDTCNNQHPMNIPPSMQFDDRASNITPSSPSYPSVSCPSQEYHPPSPSQDYHSSPPQHSEHLARNYPFHETSAYSFPHFQSYPSFSESILPSAPPTSSYSSRFAPLTTNHLSSTHESSLRRNGTVSETSSTTQTYQYDNNYQPSPEKIAEAQEAARFSVGALVFDDVSTAIDHLRKSLELLTSPSSGQ